MAPGHHPGHAPADEGLSPPISDIRPTQAGGSPADCGGEKETATQATAAQAAEQGGQQAEQRIN